MHDSRIRSLESRLEVLRQKEEAGWAPEVIGPDRERTLAELAHLRGIRARNEALDVERPALAAQLDATTEAERAAREAAELRSRSREEAHADEARDAAARIGAEAEVPGVAAADSFRERRRKVKEALQRTSETTTTGEGA